MSMKFRCFLCFLTALLLISGCAGKEDGKKYPSEYEPSPSPKMSELRLPSSSRRAGGCGFQRTGTNRLQQYKQRISAGQAFAQA